MHTDKNHGSCSREKKTLKMKGQPALSALVCSLITHVYLCTLPPTYRIYSSYIQVRQPRSLVQFLYLEWGPWSLRYACSPVSGLVVVLHDPVTHNTLKIQHWSKNRIPTTELPSNLSIYGHWVTQIPLIILLISVR